MRRNLAVILISHYTGDDYRALSGIKRGEGLFGEARAVGIVRAVEYDERRRAQGFESALPADGGKSAAQRAVSDAVSRLPEQTEYGADVLGLVHPAERNIEVLSFKGKRDAVSPESDVGNVRVAREDERRSRVGAFFSYHVLGAAADSSAYDGRAFDYPRLFGGDLLFGIAEISGVVERDVRDRGDHGSTDHVCRIKPAAHPAFENDRVAALPYKIFECARGYELEFRRPILH